MTYHTCPRAFAAIFAFVAVAGCTSPLDPDDVAGTYVYAPAGGQVTRSVVDGIAREDTLMIADTITLRADGTGVRSGRSYWITRPPGAPDGQAVTWPFVYTIDGVELTLLPGSCVALATVDCGASASTPRFRILGGHLLGQDLQAPLAYARVGPPAR